MTFSPRSLALAAVASVGFAATAGAADLLSPVPAATVAPVAAESVFDVSFGVTATTDYVSRGVTQTNGGPAIQPWVELDIWKFYAGAWFSNVDFDYTGTPNWETDLSIGFRPVLGPVTLDLGYVRYYYDGDDTSGEAYLKATWAATDKLSIGGQFFVDPEATEATYAEINAAYALPYDFKVSGALGFRSNYSGSPDYTTWNLGVSYTYKSLTFDLRYIDSDLSTAECGGDYCGTRIVGSISFASSLKQLGILK